MPFNPRPKQREILQYRHGKMGVSAVPGSGKTQTLAYLAAQLIAGSHLADDQEVLIVTLVNSAVDNISQRIAKILEEFGLVRNLGYRVRTLHGVAHDIVRDRPALVGLTEDFQIINEYEAGEILDQIVNAWTKNNPSLLDEFLRPGLSDYELAFIQREKWPSLIRSVAGRFIHDAKDAQETVDSLWSRWKSQSLPLSQMKMGCEIYEEYNKALQYRAAVDFDDLIRLALLALQTDKQYLQRLQHQWPYILEDEAQDSSLLQENIMRLLAGPKGNWVRVGDPNQAIYESFTTASPEYLRNFRKEPGVRSCDLPNSGRSTKSIIDLANYLIHWTNNDHPNKTISGALEPPEIIPTPPGDPQSNPSDTLSYIRFIDKKYSETEEINDVVKSLRNWLPAHPDQTVAVLVPRNSIGEKLFTTLKTAQLDPLELLKSTSAIRETLNVLTDILHYLSDPTSSRALYKAYLAYRRPDALAEEEKTRVEAVSQKIGKCKLIEDYLYPTPDHDWISTLSLTAEDTFLQKELVEYRETLVRWQKTVLLHIDQMIISIAQDLFETPMELALAHTIAIYLRRYTERSRESRLPEMIEEIKRMSKSRDFQMLSEEEGGFDPDKHKGKVVISTIHKAKGLEWDRVYMMSVNNYDYPSGMDGDSYFSEKEFLKDRLNLEVEIKAQLSALLSPGGGGTYIAGEATQRARIDYVSERLRMLFVGITRAKKELIVTWNSGSSPNHENQPALPFIALRDYWKAHHDDPV